MTPATLTTLAKPDRWVQIFVPGILQWPQASNLWDARAQTWSNLQPDEWVADRADYFCTAVGRAFFQEARVRRVVDVTAKYVAEGYRIVLVSHSNGTDLVLKALAELGWPRIEAVHLLSGACQADFRKNGLNEALDGGKVGRVFVYVAGQDRALRLANHWWGRLLGYGVLGLHGPTHAEELLTSGPDPEVQMVTEPYFGHSDWFAPENFRTTMLMCRRV